MTNRKRKRRKERLAHSGNAENGTADGALEEGDEEDDELEDEEEQAPGPKFKSVTKSHNIRALQKALNEKKRQNPDQAPRHLVEVLNHVFAELDKNHDNVLSQVEVDSAVIDSNLQPGDVEGVAILKACFSEVKDLHKEGWFAKKNGVTLADLLVFEQVILREKREVNEDELEKLREIVITTTKNAHEALRAPKKLYADSEHPEKSIRPQAIRQGIVGDCYFLAALASVAASNPAMIKWMIQPMDNKYYQVIFAGSMTTPIVVPEPTAVELALYAKVSEFGIWPAVLEKAYGQYLLNHRKTKMLIPAAAADAAESTYEAFDLITGQTGHWEALPLLSNEQLKNILDSAFKEKRSVAAGTFSSKTGYTQDAKLPSQHAYSVLGWNSRKEELVIRNPWGRVSDQSNELENEDGIFTINLNVFRRNFVAIYYEDWTPDPNIDDSDLPFRF